MSLLSSLSSPFVTRVPSFSCCEVCFEEAFAVASAASSAASCFANSSSSEISANFLPFDSSLLFSFSLQCLLSFRSAARMPSSPCCGVCCEATFVVASAASSAASCLANSSSFEISAIFFLPLSFDSSLLFCVSLSRLILSISTVWISSLSCCGVCFEAVLVVASAASSAASCLANSSSFEIPVFFSLRATAFVPREGMVHSSSSFSSFVLSFFAVSGASLTA
mmetsp:Transcript_31371/g.46270  ORF Transcript_31371/g.46270 Transcript_31371/m.46270 type:complete len:223 (-) Transcript_31371:662-1330(-)